MRSIWWLTILFTVFFANNRFPDAHLMRGKISTTSKLEKSRCCSTAQTQVSCSRYGWSHLLTWGPKIKSLHYTYVMLPVWSWCQCATSLEWKQVEFLEAKLRSDSDSLTLLKLLLRLTTDTSWTHECTFFPGILAMIQTVHLHWNRSNWRNCEHACVIGREMSLWYSWFLNESMQSLLL